jgi:hypothetical protein
LIAPFFRAGEADCLAQRIEKRGSRVQRQVMFAAIDHRRDRKFRAWISRRRSLRCGWRYLADAAKHRSAQCSTSEETPPIDARDQAGRALTVVICHGNSGIADLHLTTPEFCGCSSAVKRIEILAAAGEQHRKS